MLFVEVFKIESGFWVVFLCFLKDFIVCVCDYLGIFFECDL